MIRVDGAEIEYVDGSVLDACRRSGANVPTLCYDRRTERGGHCRACIVEVDGRWVAACSTPARDGIEIRTAGTALTDYRRDLTEFMAAEATLGGSAAELAAQTGARVDRYPSIGIESGREDSHPYLRIDLSTCIKCHLCIDVCAEVQGQFVYAMQGRGAHTRVSWGAGTLREAGCVSCGACASVCPTGAITDVDRIRLRDRSTHAEIQTTCGYCGVGCQLLVRATADEVLQIDGADAPVNRGHLCVKGRYAHRFVHHPDRLRSPLVRRNGRLAPATWEEAYAVIVEGFARLRGKLAALSSSRCTNEENYLVQKWFRAGLGTHNVDCCARVCHSPTARGMREVLGTGAATNSIADIGRADAILVTGSNATEAHPVTGARLRQAALRGARLVVIDPRRTELAEIADEHLQLCPGTNVLLLNSLAHVLVEENLIDHAFIDARAEGFERYATFIRAFTPEATAAETGVRAEQVRRAARIYGRAERPLQVHGLGVTEHHQGSEAVMLLCNLATLCGAYGRPGVGVNPLRGQNNVQGAADMGCQPDLLTGYADPADPVVRERFERAWGRPVPQEAGLTIPKMYDAMRDGRIRGVFILGEDVVAADPEAHHIRDALGGLELLVVQELFPSATSEFAHVVLPGASFFEKDGTFTNGERRIQRVRRVVAPVVGSRPDWQILCELMAATGYPQTYTHPSDIMDEIARVTPSFAGVNYERLEGDGLQWPVPMPNHAGTPILHTTSFPRGRALLSCVEYVPSPSRPHEVGHLRLVTGRALEHYNTGSMTRRTDNARLLETDWLELHPSDARSHRLSDGSRAKIRSRFGQAVARVRITERVAPGTLFLTFHFPETGTNDVVSDVLDRMADCPEYKLTDVEIEPA